MRVFVSGPLRWPSRVKPSCLRGAEGVVESGVEDGETQLRRWTSHDTARTRQLHPSSFLDMFQERYAAGCTPIVGLYATWTSLPDAHISNIRHPKRSIRGCEMAAPLCTEAHMSISTTPGALSSCLNPTWAQLLGIIGRCVTCYLCVRSIEMV